ncbi:MAG: UPF0179 family protein [Thermoplasmata archaeon]|nr:UPF0179 family protein [Thermoplasmata archaeon]
MVTLVGERQVKIGNEFIYLGPLMDCKECKLKGVCFNLEEGRKYRIKGVRGVRHECKIHDGGVMVVEVEQTPLTIAANGKSAIEGSMITFEFPKCDEVACKAYKLCHPIALSNGGKGKILKVGGVLDCSKGHELKEVTIE